MSGPNGHHSRLILPGQQRPVVANSIDEATGPRQVSPAEAVQLLQAQGVPTNLSIGHKPGSVFLGVACGPFAVPLVVTPEQARGILQQLAEAIDAADPPLKVPVVLTDPSATTTETAHVVFDRDEIVFRIHDPPRPDDILPFLPGDAATDAPTDDD